MSKESVALIIGVVAVVIASGAFYEIWTMNNQIQNPGQINNTYSTQLGSLKSKVDSINSQVDSINSQVSILNLQIGSISKNQTTINILKNNVVEIQAKLTDLGNKINQGQTTTTPSIPLALLLDKSAYLPSDTIKIVAVGANPQKTVQIQLLDNTGYVVLHKDTLSDSAGRVSLDLQLSGTLPLGSYQVKVISDQQAQSQAITISSSGTSSQTGTFTAKTDKSVYNAGTLVQISGNGQVNAPVTASMTSPTGKGISSSSSVLSDGTYTIFLYTSSNAETGIWSIAVTSSGQTQSLSITIQNSGSTTGSTTLTAQTDKTTYTRGQIIILTGLGQPGTQVSGFLTGSSANPHGATATVQPDGTYSMVFPTLAAYEAGNWSLVVTNNGQSKTLNISLI